MVHSSCENKTGTSSIIVWYKCEGKYYADIMVETIGVKSNWSSWCYTLKIDEYYN